MVDKDAEMFVASLGKEDLTLSALLASKALTSPVKALIGLSIKACFFLACVLSTYF